MLMRPSPYKLQLREMSWIITSPNIVSSVPTFLTFHFPLTLTKLNNLFFLVSTLQNLCRSLSLSPSPSKKPPKPPSSSMKTLKLYFPLSLWQGPLQGLSTSPPKYSIYRITLSLLKKWCWIFLCRELGQRTK